jgi:hypothetical protein
MVALLFSMLAFAGDPPPPPPPSDAADDADTTIVVYGYGLEVERARQQLIKQLASEGYTTVIRKDGYTILRHENTWDGDVLLYDDGWVRIKRQPLQIRPIALPFAKEGSALSWAACALAPFACVRTSGLLYGKRKFSGVKNRTLHAVEPEIQNLADRVADQATAQTIETLPKRLEALWTTGAPIDPDDRVCTSFDDKKAALLDYWDSRTDTPWGDRVRLAVEAFVRGEVQTSEHAFSAEEIVAFNQRRSCSRELDLDSEWAAVAATVQP